MIVEVRKYTIKPGLRARFIDFFETRAVPAQRGVGMGILGPLLDLENPDVFIWLRGFPSLEERERMKTTFYEGELWLKELEAIAMPMLERYEVILTETSPGVVNFFGGEGAEGTAGPLRQAHPARLEGGAAARNLLPAVFKQPSRPERA